VSGNRLPEKTRYALIGAASILLGAVLWEVVARAIGNPLFFSPLSAIAAATVRLWASGDLQIDCIVSFQEFLAGFALAAVVGIAVGLLMAVNKSLNAALAPWVDGFQSTPLVALGPLFVLWFGLGPPSKIAIVFLVSVFSIVLNTMGGVQSAPPHLIELARSFAATRWQLYREVLLPAAFPFILVGLRLGVARALLGVVVGELFASKVGLGNLIVVSAQTYDTAGLFVGVLIFAFAGVVANRLLLIVEAKFSPWKAT
jgi:ABC-type nitrate/sulfonate/bicarbonate transport system permease component